MAQLSFHRVEKKFIITDEQRAAIREKIAPYMTLDGYCAGGRTYEIQNVYYDTENNTLISRSLEKPIFKQKMRVRKYTGTDELYLEIKKKSEGVVGKRRIAITEAELEAFIERGIAPERTRYVDRQIVNEMMYFLSVYKVAPKVFISYDRLGYFKKDDSELRITFDNNIRARTFDLAFDRRTGGVDLLGRGLNIMEIKYNRNYPLWLAQALSETKIRPGSFSKYGTEYKMSLKGEMDIKEVRACV